MSEENDQKEKTGVRPSQVIAAALAAVTAAFLGASLGVAGTVVGAGLASVVTTVGSELYLRSLRKTKEAAKKTKEVAKILTDPNGKPTKVVPVVTPGHAQATGGHRGPGARTGPLPRGPHVTSRQPGRDVRQPAFQRQPGPAWPTTAAHARAVGAQPSTTSKLPVAGSGGSEGGERTVLIPGPGGPHTERVELTGAVPTQAIDVTEPPEDTGKSLVARLRKLRWPLIIGTSVAAFAIGMLVLTGIEATTGQPVSGGTGTTFGKVIGGGDSGQVEQPKAPEQQPNQDKDKQQPSGGTTDDNGSQQPSSKSRPTTTTPSAPPTTAPPTSSVAPSSQPRNGGEAPAGQSG